MRKQRRGSAERRRLQRRAKKLLRQHQRRKVYRRIARRRRSVGESARRQRRRDSVVVKRIFAPEVFSMVHDPKGLLQFLATARRHLRVGRRIFADLSRIRELGVDGIVCLLSHMADPRFTNRTPVFGNSPSDPALSARLAESGFYGFVRADQTPARGKVGVLATMKQIIVDPELADSAVSFASIALFGRPRRNPALYRTLIECMANTKNHAALSRHAAESWWLVVSQIPGEKRVSFAFIDNGVGILKSMALKFYRRLLVVAKMVSSAALLEGVVTGEIASRTGLPHRGKGLPRVYEMARSGRIQHLTVVANDVHARLASSRYTSLRHDLDGSFLYWEVSGAESESWLD